MNKFTLLLTVAAATTCALAAKAPKTAAQYYSDAAFQYIENRLPTAEITCKEGLSYYPDDAKLQMLKDRIEESKNEQQKQNQQNNPKNENQNQDQNQDKNQNQDQQNQDQQNQDQQNQDQQNQGSSSSQNEDQNQGGSSDSQGGDSQSSDSNESQQPDQPQGENENPEEVPEGQMSPQQASQLLKDFDEEHGERKPWKPVRGQARPEKDW
ncbi:MAG: hypothetical protein SPL19_07150 [Fibrobacter sp.]|nr:hypothetical protein [Fibrobacter sp.]MDY6370437.1 hypothetical protein [Fibrobacter sp.]MDY6390116.1 hypothetical protein [Fibrobacter sp.]